MDKFKKARLIFRRKSTVFIFLVFVQLNKDRFRERFSGIISYRRRENRVVFDARRIQSAPRRNEENHPTRYGCRGDDTVIDDRYACSVVNHLHAERLYKGDNRKVESAREYLKK